MTDHEDYQPAPKSLRHRLADQVAEWVRNEDLAQRNGGLVERDEKRRYYRVRFSVFQSVAGSVFIFSATYISVSWSAMAAGVLPTGQRLFASWEEAQVFLSLAFKEGRGSEAMMIPEKVVKRRVKKEIPSEYEYETF